MKLHHHEDEAFALLDSINAIRTGHFVYREGDHGSIYIDHHRIFYHIKIASYLAHLLADQFVSCYDDPIEVVVGPADGGAKLALLVAYRLFCTQGIEVLALEASSEPGSNEYYFKPGIRDMIRGKRVLVVDDVMRTGKSINDLVMMVRSCRGTLVGAGVLFNRSGIHDEYFRNIPKLCALINLEYPQWNMKLKSGCRLCNRGIPISEK